MTRSSPSGRIVRPHPSESPIHRVRALALLVPLTLVGCTGVESVHEPQLGLDDLAGLVREEDGLESLEFTASGIVTDAAEDLATMTEYWEHAAGDPATCLPAFLSSALVDEGESDASGDDATMELANFRETGDVVGLVIVNARLFDTAADASAFLDARRPAVDACPDGYTLSDHGELSWRTTGFEVGELAGAPSGVRSLVIDELPTGTDATGQRTIYLERGNAVVAVYGESYAGGSLEMDDLGPVALAIAERLAAIRP